MLLMSIDSFRDLTVRIIGDLSPSMYFLYDVVAVLLSVLFLFIIYGLFNWFFHLAKRW